MPMGPSRDGAAVPPTPLPPDRRARSGSGGGAGDVAQSRWAVAVSALCGSFLATGTVALVESAGSAIGPLPLFGILLPLAVLAAALAWVGVRLFLDPTLPAVSSLLQSSEARARLLILGPLTVAALVLAAVLTQGLFGAFAERPSQGGLLVALVTLGVLTFAAHGAEALAPLAARALGRWSVLSALGAFVVSIALSVGALIFWGDPAGGRGPLSLFGVLRRDELNLLPVLQGVGVVMAASALAGWRQARPKGWKMIPRLELLGTLGLAGLSSLGLVRAAGMTPREAVALERTRGLAAPLLATLATMADRDHDGAPGAFGGGDCDDSNPAIGPNAVDVPGNGIDEDCSGGDAEAIASPGEAEREEPAAGEAPRAGALLPPDANVLLLTVDTLRHDLGYAREVNPKKLSPRLDELASRSTVFRRGYSLASYTSKSLGPMLLGLYPSETRRTFEHFDRFDPSIPFVQQRLQAAGIRTVSAQAYWYFFMDGYGLNRGWDVLDHSAAPRAINIDGDSHVSGEALADVTVRELEKLEGLESRFFFWTHWVDPHSEYVRHEGFDFGPGARERYDSEVAFVDSAIGRVLDALALRSFAARTVVIVTSDHGEAFGEHGMIRHGFELWEELVRVPLLVYVPGARAHRIDTPRSLIDVTKTILDVFGVDQNVRDAVRGTSLLADVALGPDEVPTPRPVFVDMPQGPHNQERRAFISGGRKLVTSAGRVIGLYDLAGDAAEKRDLSGDPVLVKEIQAEMTSFVSQLHPVPARR